MRKAKHIRADLLKLASRLEKAELPSRTVSAKKRSRSMDERITKGHKDDAALLRMRTALNLLKKTAPELDSLLEDYATDEARELVEKLVTDLRATLKPIR